MAKREIKFRGKRVDNGQWAFGDLTKIEGHEDGKDYKKTVILEALKYDDYNGYVYQFIPASVVDPETVDQMTGLKDCDGTDIYNGDIVTSERLIIYSIGQQRRERRPNDIGVVRRDIKNGCLVINNDNGQTKRLTAKVIKENRVKVIGNIYENPELLRNKK